MLLLLLLLPKSGSRSEVVKAHPSQRPTCPRVECKAGMLDALLTPEVLSSSPLQILTTAVSVEAMQTPVEPREGDDCRSSTVAACDVLNRCFRRLRLTVNTRRLGALQRAWHARSTSKGTRRLTFKFSRLHRLFSRFLWMEACDSSGYTCGNIAMMR